jgi:hypothetical protein
VFRIRRPLVSVLIVVGALTACTGASIAATARTATNSCKALSAPRRLDATLLAVHRTYMSRQPDVHNPTITGPVGHVYLGVCGTTLWALADFDARYNGYNFGVTDQPERFDNPKNRGWTDLGNTGGLLCDAAPAALLKVWKLKGPVVCPRK